MDIAPLKQLGRYQLVKPLASGGIAEILLARSQGPQGFEREVVIKRIRTSDHDPKFVQSFLEEARLAASLHHQNIVQVHDIGEQGGEYFFAMEYVHGCDLRRLLKRLADRNEQVPLEHIVTITQCAASALHCAHEHGVVHRDVSPANVLVGYDGTVKVADFGLAKAAMRTVDTRSGYHQGTVAYMSPEQCLGRKVDRRSDIFSLGICLYELATVRRLFKGGSDFNTIASIVYGRIPSPVHLRDDMPAELVRIILKALAATPTDRYQTADALRADLERFAVAHGLPHSPSSLGGFITRLIGEKPLPWLTEGVEIEPEPSIDFDGSVAGVVEVPDEAARRRALADCTDGSPMAFAVGEDTVKTHAAPDRARSEDTTRVEPAPLPPPPRRFRRPSGRSDTEVDPPKVDRGNVTVTQILRPEHPGRRRWLVIAGAGAAIVVFTAVAFAVATIGEGDVARADKPMEPIDLSKEKTDPTPPTPRAADIAPEPPKPPETDPTPPPQKEPELPPPPAPQKEPEPTPPPQKEPEPTPPPQKDPEPDPAVADVVSPPEPADPPKQKRPAPQRPVRKKKPPRRSSSGSKPSWDGDDLFPK